MTNANHRVTEDDVRHVASLARLALDEARVPALVAELDGILRHMAALHKVDTRNTAPAAGVGAGGTPLRADEGPAYPLAYPREAFAPALRDGFFVVPRLPTHGDGVGEAGGGERT
jgi:aspartyl-tRNA(Asn)/glutamyl-tRNA(Gln) amidotransferase subunit C